MYFEPARLLERPLEHYLNFGPERPSSARRHSRISFEPTLGARRAPEATRALGVLRGLVARRGSKKVPEGLVYPKYIR